MLISIGNLNEWAASDDMCKWFMTHFPSGSAEYQEDCAGAASDLAPNNRAHWLENGVVAQLKEAA